MDLTLYESSTKDIKKLDDDLVVIGVPVYGGRVPPDVKTRLKLLKAEGIPAALIVVYGNRAYEDALLELKDLAVEINCIPIAGAVFIGEHSLSTNKRPIVSKRPDGEDIIKAMEFGGMIQKKIMDMYNISVPTSLYVPGNFPYKEVKIRTRETPVTRISSCEMWGIWTNGRPKWAIELQE